MNWKTYLLLHEATLQHLECLNLSACISREISDSDPSTLSRVVSYLPIAPTDADLHGVPALVANFNFNTRPQRTCGRRHPSITSSRQLSMAQNVEARSFIITPAAAAVERPAIS